MFSLNVTCGVCKTNLKGTDSLTSTSCGHIFHLNCLNNTLCRLNSCPVCKALSPKGHPIYLSFENSREYETVVKDLKEQLQVSTDNIKSILAQNDKKDKEIDKFKRLYNVSEQWRASLEDKVRKLSDELELKKGLPSNESNSELENGEENNAQSLLAKIHSLSAENLKLSNELKDNEASKMILNYKIEIQEQRLKHIAKELENEIAEGLNYKMKQGLYFKENNSKLQSENDAQILHEKIERLSAENLKLSKLLKDTESSNMILSNKIAIQEQRLKHVAKELNKEIADSFNYKFNQVSTESINQVPSQKQAEHNGQNKNRSNSNRKMKDTKKFVFQDSKIMIKDFPRSALLTPLENSVILLASHMSISLTYEDIVEVHIIDRMTTSSKVALAVEFKTIDNKIQFFENRNRLKFHEFSKTMTIKEYIDEKSYSVFMYANRKLRNNGYEYVGCRNNEVTAKKKINDREHIVIKNKADVDSMCQRGNMMRSLIDRSAPSARRTNEDGISNTFLGDNLCSFDF